jgi:hypothetical protein
MVVFSQAFGVRITDFRKRYRFWDIQWILVHAVRKESSKGSDSSEETGSDKDEVATA